MINKRTLVQIGDCEFDPISHTLLRNKEPITPELTASEAKLLIYLYENSDRIINRGELLKHVASERVVDDAIITQYIKTLRKALGDTARNPRYIRTYQKEGYQLIAPVKVIGDAKKSYGLLATVIALIVISGFTLEWLVTRSVDTETHRPYPITSLKGHEFLGTASPDSRFVLFSHKTFEPGATWQLVIKPLGVESYYQLTLEKANHIQARFSQNGNNILYHVFNRDLNEIRLAEINWQTFQLENIQTIKQIPIGSYTVYLAWKDENSFYYASKSDRLSPASIKRYYIEQQREETITQPPANGAGDLALAYSPDEQKLAFLRNIAYSKSEIYTYDETTQALNLHYSLPIEPISLDWDSNDQLIIRDKETSLSLLDTESNEITPVLSSRYPIYAPFFIDENTIGFTQGDFIISDIQQGSLNLNTEAISLINSSFNDYRPSFAIETKSIAFLSNRTGLDQIWVREENGSLRQVTKFTEAKKIQHIAISPDGKLIAYTTNATIVVIDSFAGEMIGEIVGDDKSYIDPEFGQESEYLYFTFKHNEEWFIERRSIYNLAIETILTKGFLVKPCLASDCYYYLRLTDKMLMKRYGLEKEESTGVTLENVGFANQFEVIGNRVFYTSKTNGEITLFRHEFGQADAIVIMNLSSLHFAINPDSKRIYYSTRRANDTNIEGVQTK